MLEFILGAVSSAVSFMLGAAVVLTSGNYEKKESPKRNVKG